MDFLEPQEATLWRRLEDGRQVRVKIDVPAVLAGNVPDFALQAGDILDVPHTAHTRTRQWVAQNIQIGPFGVTAVYDPLADRRARILRDDNNNVFQRTLLQSFSTNASQFLLQPITPVAP